MDVSSEEINITTYTVDDLGNATEFDSFKIVKNSTGTGVESTEDSNNIRISYNASSSNITVEGMVPETVEVFSVDGKLVASATGAIVSATGFADGCYIVKAVSGKKSFFNKIYVD